MKTEFTKSPWFVGMRSGHNANTVYARDGEDNHTDSAIALVYGIPQNRHAEEVLGSEGMPNAHLIAAAPDLYAALERTLSWLTSYQGEAAMSKTGPYEQARAALAKARGEA